MNNTNENVDKTAKAEQLNKIADMLGLEFDQVKNWIKRNNRKERNLAQGITPKPKGRPRKQTEIEQLRMENKLLRDFLQFTGRM